MKHGKRYLITLDRAPDITSISGTWGRITYEFPRHETSSTPVTPDFPVEENGFGTHVQVMALQDGADPVAGDRLVYRGLNANGEQADESREIVTFTPLDD